MGMVAISEIRGNQFMKARVLFSAVVLVDARTFLLPSATREERDHTVRFDSAESPTACSCTCEAGMAMRPCWAMARALDVLALLGVNKVYVGRGPAPAAAAAEIEPAGPPLRAAIIEGGEMALLARSATPLAGMLLNVP